MTRHDCRAYLEPAAQLGSVDECPVCGRWWQWDVVENERGRWWRWRRIRPWHLFARHEVAKTVTARHLKETR